MGVSGYDAANDKHGYVSQFKELGLVFERNCCYPFKRGQVPRFAFSTVLALRYQIKIAKDSHVKDHFARRVTA